MPLRNQECRENRRHNDVRKQAAKLPHAHRDNDGSAFQRDSLPIDQDTQPHPVLPCCFAFSSATQHASTSDNAGPPQRLLASGAGERLQTPVSGSTSSTRSAASRSPAMSAAIERTCSYPVSIRKVGARPYDFMP